MAKLIFKKVCLIGVGMIGGSLSRDLVARRLAREVVGFDRDTKNLSYAVNHGIVSRGGKSLAKELPDSDLVILATPVLAVEGLIREIAGIVSPHTLVIDVGSTKKKIVGLSDIFFPHGNFVGSHPMAGDERSGAKASVLGLFAGSPSIVVRGKKTKKSFFKKARSLWLLLGARVVEIPVAVHDRYLAACSHLPHVLSFALMSAVGKTIAPAELKKIAGRSFKSYTRIAGSNARMWTDIFLDNREHTLAKIRTFQQELHSLQEAIQTGDQRRLYRFMERAARLWREM